MQFTELTDGQWDYLRPFSPPQPQVGRKRADDRWIINGILFVLTTGCRWRDVPRRYGTPVTAWRRLRWWSEEGKIQGYLRRRGIRSTILSNRRNSDGKRRRGRSVRFNELTYRNRGSVERFFGWLKTGFRRLTLRYERLNAVFMGSLSMASFLIYWRRLERVLKQAHC